MLSEDPRVQGLIQWFEHLQPESLSLLETFYTPEARFKDPFNQVQGYDGIRAVFEHMFRALREPRFVVHEAVVQGDSAFLVWDFLFHFQGSGGSTEQCVRGATHFKFAPDGRVVLHRDYWDAAEELYEKLPVVGSLMRWLKRRAST
jgi:steroid Delta-isomerase